MYNIVLRDGRIEWASESVDSTFKGSHRTCGEQEIV